MDPQPQHTCEESQGGGFQLLADCAGEGGLSTGGIISIVVIVLVLGLIGFLAWRMFQRRKKYLDDE